MLYIKGRVLLPRFILVTGNINILNARQVSLVKYKTKYKRLRAKFVGLKYFIRYHETNKFNNNAKRLYLQNNV